MVCSGFRIRPAERDLGGVLPSVPDQGWLDGVPEDVRDHLETAVGRQTALVAGRIAGALAARAPTDDTFLGELRSGGFALSDEGTDFTFGRPACVLAERRDRVAGYRDQFRALERLTDAEYVAASGAGHYLPLEEPELFAAAVRRWLSAVEAAAPGRVT